MWIHVSGRTIQPFGFQILLGSGDHFTSKPFWLVCYVNALGSCRVGRDGINVQSSLDFSFCLSLLFLVSVSFCLLHESCSFRKELSEGYNKSPIV